MNEVYAVIFKAVFNEGKKSSKEYLAMAKQLRDLAKDHYGCQDFVSSTEGNQELAISYWLSLEDIHSWKNDPLHKIAQSTGAEQWYASYTVEIVEVLKTIK